MDSVSGVVPADFWIAANTCALKEWRIGLPEVDAAAKCLQPHRH
ncbi:hypothetical protein THTE_4407 [Thermogutta terrifontis]|uniref:Uncharacterized protein n=1 Tax=Thermogutta terrifontis TaxID=1331910 RepID=A0A286RM17_9BACT|nr:hypothetical protein THTE_4407 [Thermogutta terrifontis]